MADNANDTLTAQMGERDRVAKEWQKALNDNGKQPERDSNVSNAFQICPFIIYKVVGARPSVFAG